MDFAHSVDQLLFGLYPYICLAVFFVGSLLRFDREQYTWKSDSSELLSRGQLRLGSNLFHVGVLFLFFGHFFGMLTPHWAYEPFISVPTKQLTAMVSGGIAGTLALAGMTILIRRRLKDPRIHAASRRADIVVAGLFWAQLALGLLTLPASAAHLDGSVMLKLAGWAQGIVTFRGDAAQLLSGLSWVFKLHMLLGMTIFLVFPFTRLVHIWSGFAAAAYAFRPYQIVRRRSL